MKVASKLVKMDFYVGSIERQDQYLIIHSDPELTPFPAKVRLDAVDVWSMVKAGLKWPVIKYVLLMPFLYRKQVAANRAAQDQKPT
ncbi:MAG: hypothetical protein ACKOC5_02555 [Chloroflexota bacterium]